MCVTWLQADGFLKDSRGLIKPLQVEESPTQRTVRMRIAGRKSYGLVELHDRLFQPFLFIKRLPQSTLRNFVLRHAAQGFSKRLLRLHMLLGIHQHPA